ncbi:VOC family protein [Acetobacteraceae bacterium KSS8]|uniref:VOC family protein n=1 Tax=Endosaccharibacter trunci TaxID=2812733 RepID=A0ABT1WA03_9PROT|nr:VOC family protein [Acetobacteraceae bacterium KSS8]
MSEAAPAILRADHVGFAVASLDAALRFWIDGLGATLEREGEMAGAFLQEVTGAPDATVRMAVVSFAGLEIELLDYAGPDRPASPQKPFHPGFAHLALMVADLPAVLARIAPHGWRPAGTPQRIPVGARAGTLVVYVTGPDGATIELMQPADTAG